jgi:hypothetical protein
MTKEGQTQAWRYCSVFEILSWKNVGGRGMEEGEGRENENLQVEDENRRVGSPVDSWILIHGFGPH